MVFIWGLYLLLVFGVVRFVYLRMRESGKGRARLLSLFTLLLCLLLLPIPMHGGFTLLLELLLEEWQHNAALHHEARQEGERKAWLEGRFAGYLPLRMEPDIATSWSEVPVEGGISAWYHRPSGLVWRAPQRWAGDNERPTLEEAKQFCAVQSPHGYWALPSEAELYYLWQGEGERLMPLGEYGTLSVLLEAGGAGELPSIRLGRSGAFALRCVALGPGAPRRGYLSGDVPLEAWNRFQLERLQ